ncbi:MAG: DegT/DnrJ/EryC1/StrS family aminotransferase [Planctomycetes bacterium]|nr:DegT/DnrJ/EryC1/StrS family aminotransferase [Planctomycetota bacterium]
MKHPTHDMPLMRTAPGTIVLFHPYVPEAALSSVADTLASRWIGQGPKVDLFERTFANRFAPRSSAIAVGSGTDALHLAYILAGLKPGDEVIAPVFTCTATNIPFLYMGVRIRFADVQADTLNIDPRHVKDLVNEKTRAIVCVHYGGLPCDLDELHSIANQWGIPVIEDAAHALGATYKGRSIGAISPMTMFSFQAIKHITTGDGGMLTLTDSSLESAARRIRWFGIDREAKQNGIWDNDITEIGYKYQMTDIGASMGLAALESFDSVLYHRMQLMEEYKHGLQGIPGISVLGSDYADREHACWLCTVSVESRRELQRKLYEHGVETNQVHYRNDRYSIFGGRRVDLPNMDRIEDKYLVLPLHHKVSLEDVQHICDLIRGGW